MCFYDLQEGKAALKIKLFPKKFSFTLQRNCKHLQQVSEGDIHTDFFFTWVWNISSTWSKQYISDFFFFFNQDLCFQNTSKFNYVVLLKATKINRDFLSINLLLIFSLLNSFGIKKKLLKKVPVIVRSRNKVKCNNYSIGILNKLCSELHPTYHNDNFIKSRD